MNIILLPLSCCFTKVFMTIDIVDGMLNHYMNDKFADIRGHRPLNEWSGRINRYECTKFKRALKRNMRNAFINHEISVSSKNGYWSTYIGKQLSYAIFQKVIHCYDDNGTIEIQLLDLPTRSLYTASKPQITDFTDQINLFLSQFAVTHERVSIDINTTDHAIVNALNIKFMYILENIVGNVDFIQDLVKQIDDKYVDYENIRILGEQHEINRLIPSIVENRK